MPIESPPPAVSPEEQILAVLADGPATPGKLVDRTGIAKSSLRRHLAGLAGAGKVLKEEGADAHTGRPGAPGDIWRLAPQPATTQDGTTASDPDGSDAGRAADVPPDSIPVPPPPPEPAAGPHEPAESHSGIRPDTGPHPDPPGGNETASSGEHPAAYITPDHDGDGDPVSTTDTTGTDTDDTGTDDTAADTADTDTDDTAADAADTDTGTDGTDDGTDTDAAGTDTDAADDAVRAEPDSGAGQAEVGDRPASDAPTPDSGGLVCAALTCPVATCPVRAGTAAVSRGRARRAAPRARSVSVNTNGSARLAPGSLGRLVADLLQAHPQAQLSAGEIGRELGRSSGAVAAALPKLVDSRQVVAVNPGGRPARFQAASTPAAS